VQMREVENGNEEFQSVTRIKVSGTVFPPAYSAFGTFFRRVGAVTGLIGQGSSGRGGDAKVTEGNLVTDPHGVTPDVTAAG